MCDCRDGNFVVPIRPAAGMGWWLGQVLSREGRFYRINILWVQVSEYNGGNVIHSLGEYVRKFDTAAEAMDYLASIGVAVSVN